MAETGGVAVVRIVSAVAARVLVLGKAGIE